LHTAITVRISRHFMRNRSAMRFAPAVACVLDNPVHRLYLSGRTRLGCGAFD
jgi:hypothetical protein